MVVTGNGTTVADNGDTLETRKIGSLKKQQEHSKWMTKWRGLVFHRCKRSQCAITVMWVTDTKK